MANNNTSQHQKIHYIDNIVLYLLFGFDSLVFKGFS